MATGLLVVGVGEGLKLLRYLLVDDKRYRATLQLGVATDSLDADGRVIERCEVPAGLTLAMAREAARAFMGHIEQRAPELSALKVDGVALHARVRRGEQVQAPVRSVVVYGLRLHGMQGEPPVIEFEVHSGKGFYVRSLGRDLALALGTVGHLTALRRERSGDFDVGRAVTMAEVEAAAASVETAERLKARMIGIPEALAPAPICRLDAEGAEDASHGRRVREASLLDAGLPAAGCEPVLLCDAEGHPLALARAEAEGLRVVRGLRIPR